METDKRKILREKKDRLKVALSRETQISLYGGLLIAGIAYDLFESGEKDLESIGLATHQEARRSFRNIASLAGKLRYACLTSSNKFVEYWKIHDRIAYDDGKGGVLPHTDRELLMTNMLDIYSSYIKLVLDIMLAADEHAEAFGDLWNTLIDMPRAGLIDFDAPDFDTLKRNADTNM